MIPYVPKLIHSSHKLKINDLYVPNISKNTSIDFSNLWEDYINKEKLNQENMKKKKVSENENEWKGILQEDSRIAYLIPSNSRTPLECKVNTNLDELPEGYELSNKNPNIAVPNYTKHLSSWKDMYTHNMFRDVKYQEPEAVNFYQVGESNVTPGSFTVTSKNIDDLIKIQTSDSKIHNMNLDKIYIPELPLFQTKYKEKRVNFEFTPFTFWQRFLIFIRVLINKFK